MMNGRVGRRIRQGYCRVSERHIAGAGVIHLPQHRERIVDLMSAFDAISDAIL